MSWTFLTPKAIATTAAVPLLRVLQFVAIGMFGVLSCSGSVQAKAPNILVILADDMGYSDIGSFGGEIETPNIDSLAANGLRFTQFYNTARCSTTRASLLTGFYPHKVQMGHLAGKRLQKVDGYRGDLDQAVSTLPEVLAQHGYRNYMSGKWHLANYGAEDLEVESLKGMDNTPQTRGFDQFYGTMLGGNNYFSPRYMFRNDEPISAQSDDYYYTDAVSQAAVEFVESHFGSADQQQPMFLYLAYTAPHWPIQAPEVTIAKYRERYQQGWDEIRRQRHQKMIELGIINRNSVLSVRDSSVPAWDRAPHQRWEAERMAVHAAMVDHMDKGIGQVLAALETKDQLDNTLVLFMSDNGASSESFNFDNLSWWQRLMTPFVMDKWLGKYSPASGEEMAVGNKPETMPGGKAVFQSIGTHWANVSNTPFRKYKSEVHEGGVATPLLVQWPQGMSAESGGIVHEPGHVVDVMATVLDAIGIDAPTPLDGVSLMPQLRGELQTRGAIYFEHEGNRAVRDGDWKLVASDSGEWELYNIARDRTETQNLAATYPERVKAMAAEFERYANQNQVLPWAKVMEVSGASFF